MAKTHYKDFDIFFVLKFLLKLSKLVYLIIIQPKRFDWYINGFSDIIRWRVLNHKRKIQDGNLSPKQTILDFQYIN